MYQRFQQGSPFYIVFIFTDFGPRETKNNLTFFQGGALDGSQVTGTKRISNWVLKIYLPKILWWFSQGSPCYILFFLAGFGPWDPKQNHSYFQEGALDGSQDTGRDNPI